MRPLTRPTTASPEDGGSPGTGPQELQRRDDPTPGHRDRRRRLGRWLAVGLALLVLGPPVLRLTTPDDGARDLVGVTAGRLDATDVRFTNARDGLELTGQLFLPTGPGPHPAVALVNGSGPSVRSNSWYLTVADALVDAGHVVLWPDKRGSGGSEGDWRTASFEALARDAAASLDFLATHPSVDPDRVGVVGMSQGGRVASVVAAEHDGLAYAVSVVGGAVPARASLRYEESHNLRELGFLPGVADVVAWPSSWVITAVRQPAFWEAVGDFDPLPHWAEADVPVLFQLGAEDTNTDTATTVARLASLEDPAIRVEVYPGSGHALEQPVGEGDALVRPEALRDLTSFVAEATRHR